MEKIKLSYIIYFIAGITFLLISIWLLMCFPQYFVIIVSGKTSIISPIDIVSNKGAAPI